MKGVLKSKKNISFQSLIQLPKIRLNEISMDDNQILRVGRNCIQIWFCPLCGSRSNRLLSYYCRKLKDLPIISRSVNIELRVRKIFCDNSKCSKKVFSQQLPDEVLPYSRAVTYQ